MGYEIYTKPFGNWLSGKPSKMSLDQALSWQKVSQNAELMAWKAVQLKGFPYPLDLGYEHFWQKQADGQSKLAFAALVHFGPQDVCADLLGWFHSYNARQSIEAANKEVRQVFEAQHIKVRTLPAMRLQEYLPCLQPTSSALQHSGLPTNAHKSRMVGKLATALE